MIKGVAHSEAPAIRLDCPNKNLLLAVAVQATGRRQVFFLKSPVKFDSMVINR
jgi:hypothetical protein